MTTSNAKKDGASPKKTAQTSAKKRAGAEPDKTAETPEAEALAEAAPEDAQPDDADAQSDRYIRLVADFQNYKRRAEKEKSDIYAYANEKMAVDLLAVIDNFERALESSGASEAQEEGFAKGMELILKQLLDILAKNGVEEIQSLGEDFDPAVHHAVMMEETGEYESGKVSAVLGKGYRLKERVIRPAMVKVAQ